MTNKTLNGQLAELVGKHFDKIKFIEKVSLLIFFSGFVLFLFKQANLNFVLIIGAFLTALTYFLCAFKVVETENLETTGILNTLAFINFVYKVTFMSLAISYVSMIGFVIKFDNPMHFIGGVTLVITLFLSLITSLNDRSVLYNPAFYLRILICLGLLGYLTITKI
jgi:hypothetical protein